MRAISFFTVLLLFSISIVAQSSKPRFDDYSVPLIRTKLHPPKWMVVGSSGEPRDERGKMVSPTEVNFAGRYFIAAHSLGTGARYYSLTDLGNGRELGFLDRFITHEGTGKAADGRYYLKLIESLPASRLLKVRFESDPFRGKQPRRCYERFFEMTGRTLRPVGKIYTCQLTD
jgi:hypothetical protein